MTNEQHSRLSSGVAGLDNILNEGLLPERAYLVRGGPGTGKTTLGLHFLTAGAANGEPVLFISLLRRGSDVQRDAAVRGFDPTKMTFLDLSPTAEVFTEMQASRLFAPAEMERAPLTKKIVEQIEQLHPTRIFVDALTQLRYIATDDFDFHRLTLSLLRFLMGQGATVLASAESVSNKSEVGLEFLVDGVIILDAQADLRTVTVEKYASSDFQPGRHSMRLTDAGMVVFPRLLSTDFSQEFTGELIASGISELDALLGGGIERGLVTLIAGPSGSGKSLLGLYFVRAAAGRGERSVIYVYEEPPEPLIQRAETLGIPLGDFIASDLLHIVPVQPNRYLPDEFSAMVRQEVEDRNTQVVMLDTLRGYRLTLRDQDLVRSLYDLLAYLKYHDVTTLLINDVEMITGDFRVTEMGVSFTADNIIFLRYLEMHGQMRKAIGVLKKRMGDFEKTLRELNVTARGIEIGQPLNDLRGILRGQPEWVGRAKEEKM
ncbi:MAG: recombinase RecA [Phycisphaerae bacterium]|nr:recombinase RecA [Phycisphaerae bacterium]